MFCSKDPVDECGTTHNCDANAQCTNTPGSFTCGCNSGYTGSGVTCEDINECTLGSDGCDATAKCTNTVGSFSCECAAGYETAVTDSVCAGCAGDAVSIVDYSPAIFYCWSTKQWVSSCAGCANCASPEAVFDGSSTTFWNPQPSSSHVSLTLDLGAEVEVTGLDWTVYRDTSHDRAILDSYTSADGVTFTLNESKDLPSGGGASFVHTVTYDSPVTTRYLKLVARSGPYQIWLPALAISFGSPCPEDATHSMCPDIPLVCSDIDECYSPDDYNCATNAGCTNTVGSYSCSCNSGYDGDGVTCEDIEECTLGSDDCNVNAVCTNTVGSYSCSCNSGYDGDSVTCEDIEECGVSDNCDANAMCEDGAGSFSCTCNAGYVSENYGMSCTSTGVSCDDSVVLGLYEECTFPSNGCCDAAAGLTCYRKNAHYAQCLETGSCTTSNPSWECTAFEGFDSVCAEQPEATLSESAECTSDAAGCASCNEYGEQMACYQKDDFYSQCLVVGSCPPLDWGNGTHSCAATFNTESNFAVIFITDSNGDRYRRALKATVLPDTEKRILQPVCIVTTEVRAAAILASHPKLGARLLGVFGGGAGRCSGCRAPAEERESSSTACG